jgi:hypothetical protein
MHCNFSVHFRDQSRRQWNVNCTYKKQLNSWPSCQPKLVKTFRVKNIATRCLSAQLFLMTCLDCREMAEEGLPQRYPLTAGKIQFTSTSHIIAAVSRAWLSHLNLNENYFTASVSTFIFCSVYCSQSSTKEAEGSGNESTIQRRQYVSRNRE